ncbi:MAG: prepilin-type N-terminal cleavage/methylation domain-containing protein [Candidatus Omnitrophica bacterium]|nr:prepilin-type N-terminal cleavage/methylation domain-containing protein [Candidatus Omnitrophota bacterium]MDE2027839.1 prepilin-type N-terminal cleavage/methylation domain-containing protein [Candidatus Omnitrophota bacterium]MDE2215263.1 prepilin-type N-terminal cleavage/methylation domain-containing protein [Candidatus Omnitrophota bacterium]
MSVKKGFTLIEMIVVMVIAAVLAAIAIPNFITYMQQGQAKAAQANLIAIYGAQKNYYFNHGSWCAASCDNLTDINTNLSLNITDSQFQYVCSEDWTIIPTEWSQSFQWAGTIHCWATSLFQVTVSGTTGHVYLFLSPNGPLVLPGGAGVQNPNCVPAGYYCPS